MKRLAILIIFIILALSPAESQIFKRNTLKHAERSLFGKPRSTTTKKTKVREPRSVTKAKRTQEAKQKKLKKEYAKSADETRKHSYEIQTPEVKARMKQNMKDIKTRDRTRKKINRSNTKRGNRKYK